MRVFLLLIMVIFQKLAGFGQLSPATHTDSVVIAEQVWTKWSNDLYELGVEMRNDSFFVKEETVRLLKDPAYREATYPAVYNWPAALQLIQKLDLKKAFWHLMNLYETDTAHRQLVTGTLFVYDSIMDMSKVLVSSFYTYAFADPRVCRITNNHPDVYRPDLLEKKQRTLKELVSYIWAYRKQKQAGH